MNTKFIPKETNFQKWLADWQVHRHSQDVFLGKTYGGYGEIDGTPTITPCKGVYYRKEEKILLAETTDHVYLLCKGRMYVYQNILFCEDHTCFQGQLPLLEFVKEGIKNCREPLSKKALVKGMQATLSPKIAYYLTSFLEVIADAYLEGFPEEKGSS